jgi:antitoxin (DNA-binding transcriptional repressor) of toxin-antitoxin stability system
VGPEAAAGFVLLTTDRGRPVAQLTPLREDALDRMRAAGRTTPATRKLEDLPAPRRRRPGERRLSDVLADMRRSERY